MRQPYAVIASWVSTVDRIAARRVPASWPIVPEK